MAAIPPPENLTLIHEAIKREVQFRIEKKYDEAKADILKRISDEVDREKADAVAGISLFIMKRINIGQHGNTIQIII